MTETEQNRVDTVQDAPPTYYKCLGRRRQARNGGRGRWRRKGEWMPDLGRVLPCAKGYHLTDVEHLPLWLGPTVYTAEGRGDFWHSGSKVVFGEARLLRRTRWNRRLARQLTRKILEVKPGLRRDLDRRRPVVGLTRTGIGRRRAYWWQFVQRWNLLDWTQREEVARWLQERL